MNSNAHLYLPRSVVAEWVVSTGGQLPKLRPDRPRVAVASIEQLDGGCVLYRLQIVEPRGS
jgi:hypothetical protein